MRCSNLFSHIIALGLLSLSTACGEQHSGSDAIGSPEVSRETLTTGGGTFDTFFSFTGAVDYGNTGCIITNVNETQTLARVGSEASASATFEATGNLSACTALCGAWDKTFTQWSARRDWMHRQLRISGDYYGKAHYQCVVSWVHPLYDTYFCHGYDGDGLTPVLRDGGGGGTISFIDINGNVITPFEPLRICRPQDEPMPVPSCSITPNKASGNTADSFRFNWTAKNSVQCTLEVDGVNKGVTDCAGGITLTGLALGNHKVRVYPKAVSQFGYSQGGMEPTEWSRFPLRTGAACEGSVDVALRPSITTFETTTTIATNGYGVKWTTTNATSCTWSINGVDKGAIGCTGKGSVTTAPGTGFIDGINTITLTANGPGGSVSATRSLTMYPSCPGGSAMGFEIPLTFECVCTAAIASRVTPVWGTDSYMTLSPICRAAVHAGKATATGGGKVKVAFSAGLSSYKGSTRNGVTSLDYGSFEGTYKFQ